MTTDHLMHVYLPLSLDLERGEGVWLWDADGNRYLDAFAGIAVTCLGHAHPAVTQAIQEQAAKLLHTSNLFQNANQKKLADMLCRLSGLDQAFFCNSGSEAVESMLKLIRLYGHQKGIELPQVIVMENAFHGRTFATISAGGSKKAQDGFAPLMPGFIRVPYNDMAALEAVANTRNDVAAILVEPIQGEGGIQVPSDDYLPKIRALCDKQGWLMAIDEVQSGLGRTGTFLAYQANRLLPDLVSLAKGLANGIPIGACLAKESVGNLFKPGKHGSTFGGNPLAAAAAIATLTEIEKHTLWENAKKQGQKIMDGLKEKLKGHPHVKEIRGKGLMIGVELDRPCREILSLALKKGLIFNLTNESVLRFLPALIFQDEHVNQVVNTIPQLIDEFYGRGQI